MVNSRPTSRKICHDVEAFIIFISKPTFIGYRKHVYTVSPFRYLAIAVILGEFRMIRIHYTPCQITNLHVVISGQCSWQPSINPRVVRGDCSICSPFWCGCMWTYVLLLSGLLFKCHAYSVSLLVYKTFSIVGVMWNLW